MFYVDADCMTVTSDEGQFFHKAADDSAAVCGVYFITDPERTVELHFDYLDVPCDSGGLVTVSQELRAPYTRTAVLTAPLCSSGGALVARLQRSIPLQMLLCRQLAETSIIRLYKTIM
jgi:hypothetical protein